ncbi:class II glutamine amidotransferase [Chitinilyticum litopenaei]|uniref:class II glutamine amidotransferase n=1 Tax=Chitinilyticum litopenaei TaxID=1121276 RepID=UPI0004171460|nr:class II glutamine amidotransferase [Chitinilyticum litopenaei]
MCQLLGMNCNVPTDIAFSFEGFRRRGGLTDEHSDGWGIGFFEAGAWRLFLDYLPSATSPVADFVRAYPIKSLNVLAHIRKATQGQLSLANTHPFRRELWGREWLLAHNGNLPELRYAGQRFRPLGDTDSEQAFCLLLDRLSAEFSTMPDTIALFAAIRRITAELAKAGSFNVLLGVEDLLFAHCSTQLHYLIRKAPFRHAHLADADVSINFAECTTPNDRAAIIATLPLTDNEAWIRLEPGSLTLFRAGQVELAG